MAGNFDYDKFTEALGKENKRMMKEAQQSAIGGVGKSLFGAVTTDNQKYGKTMANMYTGKKLKPGIGIGVGLAGVGLAVARMNRASTDLQGRDSAALNEWGNTRVARGLISNAPAPSASTVAPSVMAGGHITGNTSNANDLGATGDMVFGMHNKRHG